MSATAAMADSTSDCQKGVAMIKAELKKKHPAPVLVTTRITKRTSAYGRGAFFKQIGPPLPTWVQTQSGPNPVLAVR